MNVDMHVVDVGNVAGQAFACRRSDLVALTDGAFGVDVDGEVGDETVAEPADFRGRD